MNLLRTLAGSVLGILGSGMVLSGLWLFNTSETPEDEIMLIGGAAVSAVGLYVDRFRRPRA